MSWVILFLKLLHKAYGEYEIIGLTCILQGNCLVLNHVGTSIHQLIMKLFVQILIHIELHFSQVLRVSYDKRQNRLYRYSSSSKSSEQDNRIDGDNCRPFNSKRKRSSKDGSPKYDLEQNESLRTGKPKICHSIGVDDQSTETNLLPTGDHDNIKHASDSDMHVEDGRNSAFINCAFPRQKPMRAKRFFWTDTLDRYISQLVIGRIC